MKWSATLAAVVSLVTVVAFAGLIPLGHWQDEYFTLYHFHESGFVYFGERLLHWSPRPLSEFFAYLYGLAVYRFDSPLIAEFLAIFWLIFVTAALWPVLHNRGGFLCACVLTALMLLGHPVTEVFYWPFATVAYLPTLAAALLLLTLDWGGQIERRSGDTWTFIALMVAAASSEVGALFSSAYIVLLMTGGNLQHIRRYLVFTIPLLLSAAVLYFQFTGRVAAGGEVFGDPSIAHHALVTLGVVAKHFSFELLKGDSGHHASSQLLSGLATKLLFFCGVYAVMSGGKDSSASIQRRRLTLAIAALATAALTYAAAFYNFGSPCCERHATMRQEYVFIAIGSTASYLASRWPNRTGRHAGLLLLGAVLIPLVTAIPKLKTEYVNYNAIRRSDNNTWRSGRSAEPVLRIEQVEQQPVTGSLLIAPGTYRIGSQAHNEVPWMLMFFGKTSAVITAPANGAGSSGFR